MAQKNLQQPNEVPGKDVLQQLDRIIHNAVDPELEYWQAVRYTFIVESGMMMAWQLVLEQGLVDNKPLTRADIQTIGQIITEKREVLYMIINLTATQVQNDAG